MTTGPRPTPHPIVLHLDDNGTPVRFAESSSIFVSSITALTVSAATWLGLNSSPGYAAGESGFVQIGDGGGGFKAFPAFNYDDDDGTLFVTNINASVSGSFDSVKSDSISSTNIISDQIVSPIVSATLVSAVTVCATNYNNLFDALSFENLDNRYLNSSGDSVTGSFFIGTVSASNISATTYLNLPSALATWNASAIRGFPVSSTPPELGHSLVYNGNSWVPSSVAGLGGSPGGEADGVIQIKNGGIFSGVEDLKYNSSVSALQSNRVSATTVSAGSISVNTISATTYNNLQEDDARWNASKFQGTLFNKGFPTEHDLIGYKVVGLGGEYLNYKKSEVANFLYPFIQSQIPSGTATWNASAIRGVTVTSTAPSSSNVLMYNGSVWGPSSVALSQLSDATGILSASGGQVLIYSSSVNKWQPGYKIYQSSSTPNNTLGLNGDIYFQYTDATGTSLSSLNDVLITVASQGNVLTWDGNNGRWIASSFPNLAANGNASSLLGRTIEPPVAKIYSPLRPISSVGAFYYAYDTASYFTVPFNSNLIGGSHDILNINGDYAGQEGVYSQGLFVASYLGSASEYFQINPYWNSPALNGIIPGYTFPHLPSNDDVLIFTDDLYEKSTGLPAAQTKAWTWKSLSLSSGIIKDVDTDGAVANQILSYNGSKWSYSSTAQLSNVSATSGIFINVTGTNSTLTNVTATNSTLTNVTATNATVTSEVVTSATINNIKTTRHAWTRKSIPISAGNLSIDLSQGQIFDVTLSANITSISVSNSYPGTVGQEFTLIIKYNANSAGKSIQWSNGTNTYINWEGGTAGPTLGLVDGELDIFKFITVDEGANWYAYVIGQSYITQ
jgi:hypothetical protein